MFTIFATPPITFYAKQVVLLCDKNTGVLVPSSTVIRQKPAILSRNKKKEDLNNYKLELNVTNNR